jgi:hypothetical protein
MDDQDKVWEMGRDDSTPLWEIVSQDTNIPVETLKEWQKPEVARRLAEGSETKAAPAIDVT